MNLPVRQLGYIGKATLGIYADTPSAPPWDALGYLRANNLILGQGQSGLLAANQATINQLADNACWAPAGQSQATPFLIDGEVTADPTTGFPGLDGTGGATLNAAVLSAAVNLASTCASRHPAARRGWYIQPFATDSIASTINANTQIIAAGLVAQLTFGIVALQVAPYSFGTGTVAQYCQAVLNGCDTVFNAWGASVPRVWLVQPEWEPATTTLMDGDTWSAILEFVQPHAQPARGDELWVLAGYGRVYDPAVDGPYFTRLAQLFPSVQAPSANFDQSDFVLEGTFQSQLLPA